MADTRAVALLIPGMLNTPRIFERCRPLLCPCLEVRVLDVTTQDGLEAMAADGWAQVADLPRETPLVLLGYSMGGYVALRMLQEPLRVVQGLALAASSARADAPEAARLRERAIAAIERDFERYLYSLLGFVLSPASLADEAFVAEVRADMRAVGAAAAVRQQRIAATRADQRERLAALQMPLQIVCGSRDGVTPLHLSQEIAALAADAQIDVIDGAGHLLPFEQPARLADCLNRLVQRMVAGRR